jgi:hypothetical protein
MHPAVKKPAELFEADEQAKATAVTVCLGRGRTPVYCSSR